jgi:hypothetical protein
MTFMCLMAFTAAVTAYDLREERYMIPSAME